MSIKTESYTRKQFPVEAVQVTSENMIEVSRWCKGKIVRGGKPHDTFIQVKVMRSMNVRQTRAFVGDWVLFANGGYKVYTDAAFQRNFEKTNE